MRNRDSIQALHIITSTKENHNVGAVKVAHK